MFCQAQIRMRASGGLPCPLSFLADIAYRFPVPSNLVLSVVLIVLFCLACSFTRVALALAYIRLVEAGTQDEKGNKLWKRRVVGNALLWLDYSFIFLAIGLVLAAGARITSSPRDYLRIFAMLVLPVCLYALFNWCFKAIRIKSRRPYVVGWAPYRRFFAPEVRYPPKAEPEQQSPRSH